MKRKLKIFAARVADSREVEPGMRNRETTRWAIRKEYEQDVG